MDKTSAILMILSLASITPETLGHLLAELEQYSPEESEFMRVQLAGHLTRRRENDIAAIAAARIKRLQEIGEDLPKTSKASTHQPAPTPGNQRVLDHVLSDLQERAETGRIKYGAYLETNNGRDPMWDAYQEILDLTMYLRQAILEQEAPKRTS